MCLLRDEIVKDWKSGIGSTPATVHTRLHGILGCYSSILQRDIDHCLWLLFLLFIEEEHGAAAEGVISVDGCEFRMSIEEGNGESAFGVMVYFRCDDGGGDGSIRGVIPIGKELSGVLGSCAFEQSRAFAVV